MAGSFPANDDRALLRRMIDESVDGDTMGWKPAATGYGAAGLSSVIWWRQSPEANNRLTLLRVQGHRRNTFQTDLLFHCAVVVGQCNAAGVLRGDGGRSGDEIQRLRLLVDQLRQAESELARRAHLDDLTGLANRS